MRKIVLSLALVLAVGVFFGCSKSSSDSGGNNDSGGNHVYSLSITPPAGSAITASTSFTVNLYVDGALQPNNVAATNAAIADLNGGRTIGPIYSGNPFTISGLATGPVSVSVVFHDAQIVASYTIN